MKDSHGVYDLRVGDLTQSNKRYDPVLVLEILEEKNVFRFIDKDGIEDYGSPKPYRPKYK